MYISQTIGTYIEQLNTNEDLYHALESVSQCDGFSSLDVEIQRTVTLLLSDFEKSGVSLPKNQHAKVVEMCERAYHPTSSPACSCV